MKYKKIITCMMTFAGAACAIDDTGNNGIRTRHMEKLARGSHNLLQDIENENPNKKQKTRKNTAIRDITNVHHSDDHLIKKDSKKRKKSEVSSSEIVTAISALIVSGTPESAQSSVSSTVFSQLGRWDLCDKDFYMSPDSASALTPSDKVLLSYLDSEEKSSEPLLKKACTSSESLSDCLTSGESSSGNSSDSDSEDGIKSASSFSSSYMNVNRQASIPLTPMREDSDAVGFASCQAEKYSSAFRFVLSLANHKNK